MLALRISVVQVSGDPCFKLPSLSPQASGAAVSPTALPSVGALSLADIGESLLRMREWADMAEAEDAKGSSRAAAWLATKVPAADIVDVVTSGLRPGLIAGGDKSLEDML